LLSSSQFFTNPQNAILPSPRLISAIVFGHCIITERHLLPDRVRKILNSCPLACRANSGRPEPITAA
jgi:hypothetical protein